ncbi:hypothetical protein STENM223S_02020 [Streptomyces tendae]
MSNTPMAASPLTRAVLEIDEYVSGLGWDQPARLFALVDTARLRADQPSLADRLGLRDEAETSASPRSSRTRFQRARHSTSSWAPSPGPTPWWAARSPWSV